MKLKRIWTGRHWRPTLAYAASATLYALILKQVIEPELIEHAYMMIPTWIIPTTANVAGLAGALFARWAWFD